MHEEGFKMGWEGQAVIAANGDDYDPGVQINRC